MAEVTEHTGASSKSVHRKEDLRKVPQALALQAFADKALYSQSCGFSSSHICESRAIKKAEC